MGRLRGPRGDPSMRFQDPSLAGMESSTNDISHYIGLLDPWYERNVLGLMNLPMDVLCQVRVCQGQGGVCPGNRGALWRTFCCAAWMRDGDGAPGGQQEVSVPRGVGCADPWAGATCSLTFLTPSATAVCQARGRAPGGLPGAAAHPGRHDPVLLPLRHAPRAAAALPDRGGHGAQPQPGEGQGGWLCLRHWSGAACEALGCVVLLRQSSVPSRPLAVPGALADAPGQGLRASRCCPDREVPRAVFQQFSSPVPFLVAQGSACQCCQGVHIAGISPGLCFPN